MAKITIQDIIGTDNVGASRSVIQANTKILCDAINKIETYLNTTPNGGDLNIGNVLVKKYSNPLTNEIFRCEASGRFEGNLTVLKALTIGTGVVGEVSTFLSDVSIGRQFTISRSLNSSNKTNISLFGSGLSISDIFTLEAEMTWPAVSPVVERDVLGFNTTGLGKNNITFEWIGGTVDTVRFSSGYDGQILVVKNKGAVPTGGSIIFQDPTTLLSIVEYSGIISDAILAKIVTTFMFVATNPSVSKTTGSWKVINYVAPSSVTMTY